MDQTLYTLLGSGGSLGMILMAVLKTLETVRNFRKEDQSKLISDLQKLAEELKAEVDQLKENAKLEKLEHKKEIDVLHQKFLEIKEENAILKGLVKAQEAKEEMVERYVQKKVKKSTQHN